MIRRNFHSFPEIKAMCVEALHSGIQLKIIAALRARLLHQPIEKLAAVSRGTIRRARDQIIHIHESPGEERFQNPVASHGADFAVRFQKYQEVTGALLKSDSIHELVSSSKVRTQLAHDLMATRDLRRRFRHGEFRGRGLSPDNFLFQTIGLSRFPSYQMSSLSRERVAREPRRIMENNRARIVRPE